MGRNRKLKVAVTMFILQVGLWTTALGGIIYVDDDANAVGDGTSWESAYRYLQDALADAQVQDKPVEIHVAQGTYKPDQGALVSLGDREAVFVLPDAVALLGGYAGIGERFPNARDVEAFQSILSGDLIGDDAPISSARDLLADPTRTDNSFSIMQMPGSLTGTYFSPVLDGFTVSSANGASALYVSARGPTIRDCVFVNNASEKAGAILCDVSCPNITNSVFLRNAAAGGAAITTGWYRGGGSGLEGTIADCTFEENYATESGGAVSLAGGIYTIQRSVFIKNTARDGGAVYCWGVSITDCIFAGNSASDQGGGIWGSGMQLLRCLFACNRAYEGGGCLFPEQTVS